jgi:hypothetical protein
LKNGYGKLLTGVRAFLSSFSVEDGEKEIQIRKVVYGARKHLPTIRSDLELLEKLLATYGVR